MVKRYRPAKKVDFNSSELHQTMLTKAYEDQPRWFDEVSGLFKENFALKYATKTWDVSPTGNMYSIVVSYPRPNGKVRIFDLDAGEFYWVKLSSLTRSKVTGRNTEKNYGFNAVQMDDYRCESEDIQDNIDWESLREWDKNEAQGRRYRGQRDWRGPIMRADVARLIAVPKTKKRV